mmetsp:Transcript_22111/g.32895  ORF Transcript_22111/g.32895 Transcript_22111/m.32895 type:complete len:108 (-) Transcript_22111:35-358(-)
MFNLPAGFLTKRDAWAATFDHVFTDSKLNEPRTDAPMHLPAPPAQSEYFKDKSFFHSAQLPLTGLQQQLVWMASELCDQPIDAEAFAHWREEDAAQFLHKCLAFLKN